MLIISESENTIILVALFKQKFVFLIPFYTKSSLWKDIGPLLVKTFDMWVKWEPLRGCNCDGWPFTEKMRSQLWCSVKVWVIRKVWDESVFFFSLTHSLQTFTAAKVWRCRSAAAGAVSDTRSRKTCRNPSSSSMSTRGKETRGSLPAEIWDRRTSLSTSLPLLCILRTLLTWTSCFLFQRCVKLFCICNVYGFPVQNTRSFCRLWTWQIKPIDVNFATFTLCKTFYRLQGSQMIRTTWGWLTCR